MRNPLTGLLRKKSRRQTTRKRRSTFSSTPNERVASKIVLEHILMFTNMSVLFAALAHRVVMLGNLQSARNFAQRSIFSFNVVHHLVLVESSLCDVHANTETNVVFSRQPINVRISDFADDDESELWTRFRKDELQDILNRLNLPENIHVPHFDYNYEFNREELLIYVLCKIAYGLPHIVMTDMIFGGDSSRWGKGYNFLVKFIDDKYINIINTNSLQFWAPHFPQFAEAIRRKLCAYWDKCNENDIYIENPYATENSTNMCGLLDVSMHRTCRVGSDPFGEGEGAPRRPNAYIKQRAIYDGHHKCHGLSALTISFPNGMSTVVGIASAREADLTILTWSEVDDLIYNLCEANNLPIYTLYSDKGFAGVWLCIRTPHRGTLMFPLNDRQCRENHVMKKIRVRVEWAYGEVKKFWKLVAKYLFFKLDENPELCLQHIRVAHLLNNFRTCYRGNSLSDVTSFSLMPPSIEEYVSHA